MRADIFKFKEFSIRHEKSAMKVGTDGVLLGAWTDVSGCKRILDIGTGSGLIALMLAQRNTLARIDALDIDQASYEECEVNFQDSPWSDRLQAIHTPVQNFKSPVPYDLIVSNPPFFTAGTQSPRDARHKARHSGALTTEDLIHLTKKFLHPQTGKACFILPTDEAFRCIEIAKKHQLWLAHKTIFISKPGKKPERLLLKFSATPTTATVDKFYHYTATGEWSNEYIQLTKAFYLKL